MAVSLGSVKQAHTAQLASEKIAAQYAAQAKKQKKRKGWSSFLGGVGGKVLGAGIAATLGVASGGLLMPLIMGASAAMSKKWVDEGTKKGVFGKGLMGADVSKIKGDRYGYGKKEAEMFKKDLSAGRKTEFGADTLAKDIALSYVSAGVSGKLGGVKGAFKDKGLKGLVSKEGLGIGETGLFGTEVSGLEGAKAGLKELVGGKETLAHSPLHDPDTPEKILESPEYTGLPFEQGATATSDSPVSDILSGGGDTSILDIAGGGQQVDQWGSLVGDTDQASESVFDDPNYIGLPFEKKEEGGIVSNKPPTIADYFSSQGVSLGGSSKLSLAQILGRQ